MQYAELLTELYQRFKIDNAYSLWNIIESGGILQGSTLGGLLFNFCFCFVCDLSWSTVETMIISHANGNAPYTIGASSEEILTTPITAAP